MNILVVDDEKGIREVIKEYASLEGYNVFEADDGYKAIDIVKNEDIAIIVLDVMMPSLDGLSAYKEIKKIKSIPTIILSARGNELDKLYGFELGVDDYLTKPFSPKELMARIKAILKRNNSIKEKEIFRYNGLVMDFMGHSLFIDGKEVQITPKEFELLSYLIENKGVAITREMILNAVWGYDFFGDDRTIDTHIKMLRNNLGVYRDLIITIRGVGYKFAIPKE